ncbi:TniQ family protein [uncultured Nostoc sp.]|uniref:TniQ family protein n=1 Tax=uncultured Nostoc sp. TaxID=340711 RepID=UPI0035CBF1B8
MLNEENLTIYKSLNLQKPAIPPRSHLYSLEPIGVGTPYTESLTSYITRLAEAHCVPTGRLIYTVINSRYQEESFLDSQQKDTFNLIGSSTHHRALNGIGIIANRLIHTLERLTLRSDLRFLTMVTWSEVISDRSLFRPSRAWCPICYEEWREAETNIYEPLIWGLDQVKICPVHYQVLQTLCPYCDKKLFSLEWYSRPGYCSKCQRWLGATSKLVLSSIPVLSEDELYWQQSDIGNIKQLIANAPNFSSPIKREKIKNFIIAFVNEFFNGNFTSFANAIETSQVTVYKWYNGKTAPKISSLLKVCNFIGISLSDFLIREFNSVDYSFYVNNSNQEELKYCPSRKSIDVLQMQQLLHTALKEYPPPTLQDLKERLGIKSASYFKEKFPRLTLEVLSRRKKYKIDDLEKRLSNFLLDQEKNNKVPSSITSIAIKMKVNHKTLYKYFPDLYNEIKKKYITYTQQHKLQILNQNYYEIRKAVIELHNKGIKPTSGKIIKIIGVPRVTLNKQNHLILKEIWLELGYIELL